MTLILLDRYTESGYVTPESVNPPSREDYTARSVDDFYVEPGYYAENYTVATLSGQRDLSISSGLSASGESIPGIVIAIGIFANISTLGGKLQTGTISNPITANLSSTPTKIHSTATATLTHAGDDVQWQFADTWAEPKQESWRKRVVTSANVRVKAGVRTMPVTGTVSTAATAIITDVFRESITAAVSSTGNRTRPGSATNPVNSTLSANGFNRITGSTTQNINTAISAVGQARQIGSATLNAAVTTLSAAGRTRPFSFLDAGSFGISVTYERRRSVSNTSVIAAELSADGFRQKTFSATLDINSTINSNSSIKRAGTIRADTQFNTTVLGGKLIGIAGEILPISTGLNSRGLIIQIDPYRSIRVLAELRHYTTDAETRVISSKTQTLINTVRSESRGIRVLPETRSFLDDRGTLDPITKERI